MKLLCGREDGDAVVWWDEDGEAYIIKEYASNRYGAARTIRIVWRHASQSDVLARVADKEKGARGD